MKTIILITLLSLSSPFWRGAYAQYNLVPNPSFEDMVSCPNSYGQINRAVGWNAPLVFSTTDYFNSCNTIGNVDVPDNFYGYELAHTGNAYAAFFNYIFQFNVLLNAREYLQAELSDTLQSGVAYCIRFYVSLCDTCNYSCNNIGVYLSPVQINDSCTYPCNLSYLIPQFENPQTNDLSNKNGWTEISGSFTALGGEKYIIIGNFRDTNTTTATFVGGSSNPFFNVACYFIDDVLLTPCDSLSSIKENKPKTKVAVYPNPFHDKITIESDNQLIEEIALTDLLGRIILAETNIYKRKKELNLSNLNKGIYFLKINTNNNYVNYKIIHK